MNKMFRKIRKLVLLTIKGKYKYSKTYNIPNK